MEQVAINTSINVKDGPSWRVSSTVDADVYAVGSVALAGSADKELTLMPTGRTAHLLVIQAIKDADRAEANVAVTPVGSGADGSGLSIVGSLLVTNASVLAGLAAGGPSKLKVLNKETVPVTVSVLIVFA